MKVLHLAANDINGGAAIAGYRLHRGLLNSGIDSKMLVLYKKSDDPSVVQFCPSGNIFKRQKRDIRARIIGWRNDKFIQKRLTNVEAFSNAKTPHIEDVQEVLNDIDVINLHWTARFLDYGLLFGNLTGNIPIIWTLHDMHPFTGGCHYAGECDGFVRQCGMCPQLASTTTKDFSHANWKYKQKALSEIEDTSLNIVTPSKWLGQQSKASSLFSRFNHSVIPYGLDLDVYRPRDIGGLKDALKIPNNARVIGFVADSLSDARKGFGILTQAMEMLKTENIYLVSIGNKPPVISNQVKHIHLGRIQNDGLMSLVYSLFDVFICPSQEDNLPNTVLESLSCGTPVVGFDIGGMPDMVEHGVTGFLAPNIDPIILASCIDEIFSNKRRLQVIGEQCRLKAVNEYALNIQAENYTKLYSSLLKSHQDY